MPYHCAPECKRRFRSRGGPRAASVGDGRETATSPCSTIACWVAPLHDGGRNSSPADVAIVNTHGFNSISTDQAVRLASNRDGYRHRSGLYEGGNLNEEQSVVDGAVRHQ